MRNNLIINTIFGKTPKINKHHLPLSCKNKRNQPLLNHNNSVELEPSNTKNRDRKSTRLNSSHPSISRMPSSA